MDSDHAPFLHRLGFLQEVQNSLVRPALFCQTFTRKFKHELNGMLQSSDCFLTTISVKSFPQLLYFEKYTGMLYYETCPQQKAALTNAGDCCWSSWVRVLVGHLFIFPNCQVPITFAHFYSTWAFFDTTCIFEWHHWSWNMYYTVYRPGYGVSI